MPARAVLWDLDGTFVDSEPTHNRALLDVLATLGVSPSEDLLRRIIGTSIEATRAALAEEYADFPELDRFVEAKMKAYLARVGELHVRNGVAEVERLLHALGTKGAIVSNSDRMIVDANVSAVGRATPGLVTVSRNDVRQGKPDPESYLRAAYLLSLAPAECVVVEDSPVGAAAGLAAGMTVVAWPDPAHGQRAFPRGVQIADPVDLLSTLAPLIDRPSESEIERSAHWRGPRQLLT